MKLPVPLPEKIARAYEKLDRLTVARECYQEALNKASDLRVAKALRAKLDRNMVKRNVVLAQIDTLERSQKPC